MDKAPISSSVSEYGERSSPAAVARNDDPMTLRLRTEGHLGIDELIHLNRQSSPPTIAASSVGTPTTVVFTSRKESTLTKPTSIGTSYPIHGKGKATATTTYASSASATYGSGSDTEFEANRENALLHIGGWAPNEASCLLKGSSRTRKRSRIKRQLRQKKPEVIIHCDGTINVSSEEEACPAAKQVVHRDGRELKYLRPRRKKLEHDQLDLAEEGRISGASPPSRQEPPLTRARFYVLIGLIAAIVLTFSLCIVAAHFTGKARMGCTEGFIFGATVLISSLTVIAMVVAMRSLQEALLAGLFEFFVGFTLVMKIHDFM
ncbi:hypothetical protein CC78DRAFT_620780 [Lojkania enalia]|uniref:Uncharacterized protein n=1 Tax=Lojkania enalia TaxID=147567 RepID=A0A9P4K402_9PLEO|nr:hypothetical protein CC78DRAFT_620780 [Didymosphaeria enalia]